MYSFMARMNMNRSRIESPCVRNCCLNDQDICLGCFRSLCEICEWSGANDECRKAILVGAQHRRQAHHYRVESGKKSDPCC